MPINKHMAIAGSFEDVGGEYVATVKGMAALNSRTGMYSERFIFSSHSNYIILNNQNELSNTKELLEWYSKESSKIHK